VPLIDTHCHLDAEYFPEGAAAVVDRARAAGLERVVVIGVGRDSSAALQAIELSEQRDDVSATVGMHPHDAAVLTEQLLAQLTALLTHPQVVAVGEIGLDYHYMHSPLEDQQRVFRRFIGLARQCFKPIVVHTRSAADDTLRILNEEKAAEVGGIIHCFSEDRVFARQALDLGFDLSFSSIVTYKNAHAVHEVARWAPADRIMVETDSPYLAPVPKRGKRCEPAYVVHTARRVADLRGESFERLRENVTQTARRRFGLPST